VGYFTSQLGGSSATEYTDEILRFTHDEYDFLVFGPAKVA
jgi:radical SAM superfamily enzyme YgiQ (UPF0313 family)